MSGRVDDWIEDELEEWRETVERYNGVERVEMGKRVNVDGDYCVLMRVDDADGYAVCEGSYDVCEMEFRRLYTGLASRLPDVVGEDVEVSAVPYSTW